MGEEKSKSRTWVGMAVKLGNGMHRAVNRGLAVNGGGVRNADTLRACALDAAARWMRDRGANAWGEMQGGIPQGGIPQGGIPEGGVLLLPSVPLLRTLERWRQPRLHRA